jgi:hypothetical protein
MVEDAATQVADPPTTATQVVAPKSPQGEKAVVSKEERQKKAADAAKLKKEEAVKSRLSRIGRPKPDFRVGMDLSCHFGGFPHGTSDKVLASTSEWKDFAVQNRLPGYEQSSDNSLKSGKHSPQGGKGLDLGKGDVLDTALITEGGYLIPTSDAKVKAVPETKKQEEVQKAAAPRERPAAERKLVAEKIRKDRRLAPNSTLSFIAKAGGIKPTTPPPKVGDLD